MTAILETLRPTPEDIERADLLERIINGETFEAQSGHWKISVIGPLTRQVDMTYYENENAIGPNVFYSFTFVDSPDATMLINFHRQASDPGTGHGTKSLTGLEASLDIVAKRSGRNMRLRFDVSDNPSQYSTRNWLEKNRYINGGADIHNKTMYFKNIRSK